MQIANLKPSATADGSDIVLQITNSENNMKKQILIAFITLIAFVINCNAGQTADENLSEIEWLEKAVDVKVEENDVPAVVVAIIKNGKVETFINRGVLKRGLDEKVDENTLFQIGSLSKSFTGIIARHLIAEGKLDVNASITKYLPENISPQTKAKLQPVTVEDILFHRSGIPRDSKVYKRFGNDPMVCCYEEKDLLDDLEVIELEFKPGEKSVYSNLAYGLLGYLFERASDKSFEELLQTYVAEKYGLSNTTTKPNARQKVATPYRKENSKYETKAFEMGKVVAAGGIYSTTADLSKLMIEQMKAHQKFAENGTDSLLFLAKETKPFYQKLKYGYGIFENGDNYGHGGDVDGFASFYTFVPKKNVGMVALTSSGGRWLGGLEDALFKKITGEKVEMPTPRKTVSVPREKLHKYTGKYLALGNLTVNIVQNGDRLEAYPQGSFGPIQLFFESENKLFAKTMRIEIEFVFDENENLSNVSGKFNGRDMGIRKVD